MRCCVLRFSIAFALCLFSLTLSAQSPKLSTAPNWVWSESTADNQKVALRKTFEVSGEVKQALVVGTADNHCELFLNNKRAFKVDEWSELGAADVTRQLKEGTNVIALAASNDGGAAGALAALMIVYTNGKTQEIVTDSSWKVANQESRGAWRNPEFNDKSWASARVLGKLGDNQLPWSGSLGPDAITASVGASNQGEFKPALAENVQAPEGFKVEKIFQVPRSMGSWVALTIDPQGNLIASDQGGAGLFRITPGSGDKPTRVEKMPVNLSGAHGLLWAFDSLYAMVNGTSEPGLHRLRDTNGDGLVDSDEYCMAVPGSGEHGPHAIVLGPDQKSLFVAAGNHTKLPNAIAGSKIPQNWNEDHLLPRRWDANGHAAGILAPGGWICQVDPNGKQWTVFSMGYRNQYDMAFNADGELFAYDADMEWDFGSPWYRPTRVCHATSGSEFGWRSGTGKWPLTIKTRCHQPLKLAQAHLRVSSLVTGAKFPARYQKALFILDWTYSTIYSVDLTPDGASYSGKKSDFITGSPLPVTDAVVGLDGALYFTAGGRGTQSNVYRVTYTGSDSTAPVDGHDVAGADLRALRRKLEATHGTAPSDVAMLIEHLGHDDRFIRYAARVGLENAPVSVWRDSVGKLSKPKAVITAAIALAHQGKSEDQSLILGRLGQLKLTELSDEDLLGALRAYQLAFTRLGEPSDGWRQKLVARFDAMYPDKRYPVNAELVQLLVYLQSPTVVGKTLAMMQQLGPEPIPDWSYLVTRNAGYGGTVGKMLSDMPPSRGIHFAFMLRNVKSGWTLPQRKQYFQFLIDASKHPGGNSYGKFLAQFRDDAIATCSQAEKIVLEPLISASLVGPPIQSTPPVGPGRKWTAAEIVETVGTRTRGRDFKRGQNLYHATSVPSAIAWRVKVELSVRIFPPQPKSFRSPTWPMPSWNRARLSLINTARNKSLPAMAKHW